MTPEEASAVEDYQCSICKEKEKLEMMNDGIADTREYVVCVRGVRARSARISIILLSLVIYLENIRRNHKNITSKLLELQRSNALSNIYESLTRTPHSNTGTNRIDCRAVTQKSMENGSVMWKRK